MESAYWKLGLYKVCDAGLGIEAMDHSTIKTLAARKTHCCTNCGDAIAAGATYKRWASFDDGACTNKMHPECLTAMQDDAEGGEFTYTLYAGDQPKLSAPQPIQP